jgi:hypothetical protein
MEEITITYDGFGLNSAPYKVTEYNPNGSPNKSTKLFDLARQHGSVRVFEKFDSRSITISGEIICSSRLELDTAIDNLKRQMRRQQGTLKIDYGDGFRQWAVTAKAVVINRQRHNISYVPFSIEFESESPFATDGVTDTLIDNESITDGTASFGINIGGTMDAAPQFTLQVNTVDPDDEDVEIVIGNSASSQYLTITATMGAGSSLTIDCDLQKVFLDGELLHVEGQFPEWSAGAGNVEYSDDMTDRDIDITMTAERRYL